MSQWKNDDDGGSDEDDEHFQYAVEDKIIFLIDAANSMFRENKKGEVQILNCLKVALEVFKTKIIASDKSSIGVLFFGAANRDPDTVSSDSEGLYTYKSPEAPNPHTIRDLEFLLGDATGEQLGSIVGRKARGIDDCYLEEALRRCGELFSLAGSGKKNADFRRIWIFTNDDSPCSSSVEQAKAIKVAEDIGSTGVEISLWHLNKPGQQPFDPDLFYTRLLLASTKASMEETNDESLNEESLQERIVSAGDGAFDVLSLRARRKQFRRRRLCSLSLTFSRNTQLLQKCPPIALDVYKLISIAKKPASKWCLFGTNKELDTRTKYINACTGAQLDDTDIKTFLQAGAGWVPFEKNYMLAIKTGLVESSNKQGIVLVGGSSSSSSSSPSHSEQSAVVVEAAGGGETGGTLCILFFMPVAALSPSLSLTTPFFAFPNDRIVRGSAAAVAALLHVMSERNHVAIARFLQSQRGASYPRIAAVLPQKRTVDESGIQVSPGGFNIVLLPFAEEIRDSPFLKHAYPESDGVADAQSQRDSSIAADGEEDEVDEHALAAAECLIDELDLDGDEPFDYTVDIDSPALQQFYNVLQSVALAEPVKPWSDQMDSMLPDAKALASHAPAIFAFKAATGVTDADVVEAMEFKGKRPAASVSSGAVAKKAKLEAAKSNIDLESIAIWKDMIRAGTLINETGSTLKQICQDLGIAVSGKKQDQVDRIMNALEACNNGG